MGQKKGILGFGDSILKGVLKEDGKYTVCKNPFMSQISETMNVETSNFGRFGSTISTGNKIVTKHLEEISKSKYTLLEFGGNDCDYDWNEIAANPDAPHKPHTELKDFAINYKEIVEKIRFAGSKPILLSLPPICSEKFFAHISRDMREEQKNNIMKWLKGSLEAIGNWHEMYNIEIFKLGITLNVPVVDISSSFLMKHHVEDYLCADGIHPNQAGQSIIADTLCKYFAL